MTERPRASQLEGGLYRRRPGSHFYLVKGRPSGATKLSTEHTSPTRRRPAAAGLIVSPGLALVPLTLRAANTFIAEHHRHHRPARGCISVVGVAAGDRLCGVAVIGRPVARLLQDGFTAEVTRCCTDGTPNACSMLYGAAWRAVRALGYRRLVTYTLPDEGGASLRASGFVLHGEVGGGTWNRQRRARVDCHPIGKKLRWELTT